MPPAAVLIGATALIVGGQVASGIMQANAAKKAAKQQAKAQREAIEFQRQTQERLRVEAIAERERQEARFRTQIDVGDRATREIAGIATETTVDPETGEITGTGLPDFEESELFRFQQEEGERAINRALAQRGQFGSGVALETLSDFNRQLSAEEAQRRKDELRFLSVKGDNAASNLNQTGTALFGAQAQSEVNITQLQSQALTNIGNAKAAGTNSAALAKANTIRDSTQTVASGVGSAQQQGLF